MAQRATQLNGTRAEALVYLDCGRLHAHKLVQTGPRYCRIEAGDGSRRKVASHKLLQVMPLDKAHQAIAEAGRLAAQISMSEAWAAAAQQQLTTAELAVRILPDAELDAAVLALQAAHARERAFFIKDGDQWLPVPAAVSAAVLASKARRQQQRAQQRQWERQLADGQLPPELAAYLLGYLRGDEAVNTPAQRFIKSYCRQEQADPGQLMVRHGLVQDIEQLHLRESLLRLAPEAEPAGPQPAAPAQLPVLARAAFAIDATGTVEVDDAFSVTQQGSIVEVGVHIAAPGLGLDRLSSAQARERMVSVYLVARKFPMLPAPAYQHYSLDAGTMRPAVSLLVAYDAKRNEVVGQRFALGRVGVAANLPVELFARDSLRLDGQSADVNAALETLGQFAGCVSGGLKPRPEPGHLVSVSDGRPVVRRRADFALADALVEALMKYYNFQAAKYLLQHGADCLFRDKGRLHVAPNATGSQYGWFTSPLRRLIDLYNQHQLLCVLAGREPAHAPGELRELIPLFDRQHAWARSQQRKLETYWSLRWLQEQQAQPLGGIAVAPDAVQLKDAPLRVKIADARLPVGTAAEVKCTRVDLYQLAAEAELCQ